MSGARPLLAARTSSGDASKDGGNTPGSNRPPSGRPKRTLIESACSACRRRKSRCDGLRPSCSRCQNLRTECHYEAEEGESRWSALRRRNQVLEQERDQLRELLSFVQSRPEPEAQVIFLRIRTSSYDDVFGLLRQIKEGVYSIPPPAGGSLPLPPPPSSSSGPDQRLPAIQTILDVPARGIPPAHLTHSHSLSSEDSRGSSVPDLAPQFSPGPPPVLASGGGPGFPYAPPPQHHRNSHQLLGPRSLSSEESAGSMGSTSLDPSKPYQTPP